MQTKELQLENLKPTKNSNMFKSTTSFLNLFLLILLFIWLIV